MALNLFRKLSMLAWKIPKQNITITKYRLLKQIVFPISIFTIAKCEADVPSFVVGEESLEHEFLIKQACTVNVNSASQLLTVTVVAIQDTSQKLRESLSQEISLMRQAIEWGDITPEEHWEKLIGVRGRLTDLRHNLTVLNSYMEYAEKLATVVAEISFLSGNTPASDVLCHRIDQATRVCKKEMDDNHVLQIESLDIQKNAIKHSPKLEKLLNPHEDVNLPHPANVNDTKS